MIVIDDASVAVEFFVADSAFHESFDARAFAIASPHCDRDQAFSVFFLISVDDFVNINGPDSVTVGVNEEHGHRFSLADGDEALTGGADMIIVGIAEFGLDGCLDGFFVGVCGAGAKSVIERAELIAVKIEAAPTVFIGIRIDGVGGFKDAVFESVIFINNVGVFASRDNCLTGRINDAIGTDCFFVLERNNGGVAVFEIIGTIVLTGDGESAGFVDVSVGSIVDFVAIDDDIFFDVCSGCVAGFGFGSISVTTNGKESISKVATWFITKVEREGDVAGGINIGDVAICGDDFHEAIVENAFGLVLKVEISSVGVITSDDGVASLAGTIAAIAAIAAVTT